MIYLARNPNIFIAIILYLGDPPLGIIIAINLFPPNYIIIAIFSAEYFDSDNNIPRGSFH